MNEGQFLMQTMAGIPLATAFQSTTAAATVPPRGDGQLFAGLLRSMAPAPENPVINVAVPPHVPQPAVLPAVEAGFFMAPTDVVPAVRAAVTLMEGGDDPTAPAATPVPDEPLNEADMAEQSAPQNVECAVAGSLLAAVQQFFGRMPETVPPGPDVLGVADPESMATTERLVARPGQAWSAPARPFPEGRSEQVDPEVVSGESISPAPQRNQKEPLQNADRWGKGVTSIRENPASGAGIGDAVTTEAAPLRRQDTAAKTPREDDWAADVAPTRHNPTTGVGTGKVVTTEAAPLRRQDTAAKTPREDGGATVVAPARHNPTTGIGIGDDVTTEAAPLRRQDVTAPPRRDDDGATVVAPARHNPTTGVGIGDAVTTEAAPLRRQDTAAKPSLTDVEATFVTAMAREHPAPVATGTTAPVVPGAGMKNWPDGSWGTLSVEQPETEHAPAETGATPHATGAVPVRSRVQEMPAASPLAPAPAETEPLPSGKRVDVPVEPVKVQPEGRGAKQFGGPVAEAYFRAPVVPSGNGGTESALTLQGSNVSVEPAARAGVTRSTPVGFAATDTGPLATPSPRETTSPRPDTADAVDDGENRVVASPARKETATADGEPFRQDGNADSGRDTNLHDHGVAFHQPQVRRSPEAGDSPPANATAPARATVAEQAANRIREHVAGRSIGEGGEQVVIRLTPEDLGELKVNLRMDNNCLKVEIVAETSTVRDTLLRHSETLRETLARQNITMDTFDVSTGGNRNGSPQQGRDEWQELQRHAAWNGSGGYRPDTAPEQPRRPVYLTAAEHSMVDVHF